VSSRNAHPEGSRLICEQSSPGDETFVNEGVRIVPKPRFDMHRTHIDGVGERVFERHIDIGSPEILHRAAFL
jgi:hypothetical protein